MIHKYETPTELEKATTVVAFHGDVPNTALRTKVRRILRVISTRTQAKQRSAIFHAACFVRDVSRFYLVNEYGDLSEFFSLS